MKKSISPTQKVLNVWAIVLILWSIYRAKFSTTLPIWVDEFIAKPAVFIFPVGYFIVKSEKKNFFEGIDQKIKSSYKDIVLGLVIGLIFFFSGALSEFTRTHTLFSAFKGTPANILYLAVISLATSISEEIVSRGFVLKRLYAESKNIYMSSFLVSILFFFLHVPILFTSQKIFGFLLLRVMITDVILSLAISFIYIQRRNLAVPILIHALYNLSIYIFT